jgi:hypothetical protein
MYLVLPSFLNASSARTVCSMGLYHSQVSISCFDSSPEGTHAATIAWATHVCLSMRCSKYASG